MGATVTFITTILKFGGKGEKTGWVYIEIPGDLVEKLKPNNKKGFRVKGKLDKYPISRAYLQPMGDGQFILPVNADMRRGTGKKYGAMLNVQLTEDEAPFVFNKDFIKCLKDDPEAYDFFRGLTQSHQRYFSKWIDDAKTAPTKVTRITKAVIALSRKMGYPEMVRAGNSGW